MSLAATIPVRSILTRARKQPLAAVGLALLAAFVIGGLFAPWLSHYNPAAIDLTHRLEGPSLAHWAGTDELGRDTMAGLGMDAFRFHAPVKAGDTLHAEVEIASKKETREPGRGVIGVLMRVLNQRGELVLDYSAKVMMKR